jgi:hypothetical protein
MKKRSAVSLCLGSFLVVSISHAADLKQSKFTQVVNDVRIVSAANSSEKPAVVNTVFNMPDLVRTGAASRAELVADDKTITRVGANTIFSFDPANRTIDLQQGSLLFHSPKGKGGGTIHTGSATASVLGTTIIVTTTHNGGFKVIDLEGHVAIKFLNGLEQHLAPGQMTFVLHDGHPAPVINIRLDTLTKDSKLVQGFNEPLPSWPLILEQIADQVKLIESGQAQDTGLLVGDLATHTTVQVVTLDPNTNKGGQDHVEESSNQTADNPPPPAPGTISGSTLPTEFIVSSPFTAGSFVFPFGFSAPNITISTPTIDLSPYGNVPEFAFVAPNGTLTISGSVAFNGLSSTAILDLFATQFSFASGSTLRADVGVFKLLPQSATTLKGVTIVDNAPASSTSGGTVTFVPKSLASSSPPTVSFPLGGIEVISPAAFSLTNGSSLSAQNLPVGLTANSITLNNSSVQGTFVGLDGTTGVNLSNSSTLTATAGNLGILTAGGDINIAASTLTAKQGASFGGANTGEVFLDAVGGTVTLTNGTTISAADVLSINGDKGISLSGSSLLGSSLNLIGSTGGALAFDNSSAQGTAVSLIGATGVTISNGSSLKSTFGDLKIATTGGNINIGSASTLKATKGATVGEISPGDVKIAAVGGTVTVTGGATLTSGLSHNVSITSDTGVSISGGSTLNASSQNFISTTATGTISVTGNSILNGNDNLSSAAALTVNGATFNSDPTFGTVDMTSNTASVTVQNASITTSSLFAQGGYVSGSGSFTAMNSSIVAPSVSLGSGTTSGSVTVQNTSITAFNLTLGAADGILLDNSSGGTILGSGGTATFNASSGSSAVTVNTADLSGFSTVNMMAHTLYFTNVNFGGTVNLTCNTGGYVINQAPIVGDVNFLGNNNTYNHTPVSGHINTSVPMPGFINIAGGAP